MEKQRWEESESQRRCRCLKRLDKRYILFFPMFCGSKRLKSGLPKAACAKPSKEKLHAVDDDEDDHYHNDHDDNYTYNYSCKYNYNTTTNATTTLPLHLHYITMHFTKFILLHSGTLHYKERVLGLDFAFGRSGLLLSLVVNCKLSKLL